MLELLLLSGGAEDQHAFAHKTARGQCNLTHRRFITYVRDTFANHGMSADEVSSHSFRRGGATFAHAAGASSSFIKALGDWRSNVYLRYIELSQPVREQAAALRAQFAHRQARN